MMVHNPQNGAIVRDLWIYDKLYFSAKNQEEFRPGDVIEIEDKPGAYLLELLGFLREVSAIEAKNIIAKRSEVKYICDVCKFEAKNQLGLTAHKRMHESSVEGVRVVKPIEPEHVEEEKLSDNRADAIEQEAKKSGLIGEGLVIEHV